MCSFASPARPGALRPALPSALLTTRRRWGGCGRSLRLVAAAGPLRPQSQAAQDALQHMLALQEHCQATGQGLPALVAAMKRYNALVALEDAHYEHQTQEVRTPPLHSSIHSLLSRCHSSAPTRLLHRLLTSSPSSALQGLLQAEAQAAHVAAHAAAPPCEEPILTLADVARYAEELNRELEVIKRRTQQRKPAVQLAKQQIQAMLAGWRSGERPFRLAGRVHLEPTAQPPHRTPAQPSAPANECQGASGAREYAAQMSPAAAEQWAATAAGLEAVAEAAAEAAAHRPAAEQGAIAAQWEQAAVAWREAHIALQAARQADPEAPAVLQAEAAIEAARALRAARQGLRG